MKNVSKLLSIKVFLTLENILVFWMVSNKKLNYFKTKHYSLLMTIFFCKKEIFIFTSHDDNCRYKGYNIYFSSYSCPEDLFSGSLYLAP